MFRSRYYKSALSPPKKKDEGSEEWCYYKKCMHEELPQVSDAMTRAIICDNEPTSDKNE